MSGANTVQRPDPSTAWPERPAPQAQERVR